MNNRRIVFGIIYAALGGAAATVACWGALYLYGTMVLHGQGSLFDTKPSIASAFFAIWFGLSAVAAVLGGYIGFMSRKSRPPRLPPGVG